MWRTTAPWHTHFAGRYSPKEISMESGSDGSGGLFSRLAQRRRKVELEAKRDALQEDIGAL